MAIDKPQNPTDLMPESFGGTKNPFSDSKVLNGFSHINQEILQGDNLNYMLDSIGQQLLNLKKIIDYLNSIGVNKIPYVNGSNKLDFTDIDGLLPSQSDNSGKYLTTNGINCLWSSDFRVIGEPIITLNFNYSLPSDCVWLDGTAGENHDGIVPTTGDWAELFAIYGYQYDISLDGTGNFRLPNFTNRTIWGGTTAGYIEAGLPNITGGLPAGENVYKNFTPPSYGAFYKLTNASNVVSGEAPNNKFDNDFWSFDASRVNGIYGRSNTVQPPAIKVRVYTRYK